MYWRTLAAWAAIAPAVFAPVTTNAQSNGTQNCWYTDEIPSVHVQTFQTMLMVGTFKCRDSLPDVIESYNKFMNSKRDFILANQRVVQAHFTRQLGSEPGNIAFLEHQTRIGNVQSLGSLSTNCDKVASLARLGAGASESDLFELARFVSGDAALTVCTNPVAPTVVADAVAPDAGASAKAVETAAADENLAPGHFVPEGPVTAEAVTADVPAPAKAVVVTDEKTAAPAEAAPAPAPVAAPTAAQALQEAAKALALAASALEAQAAPAAPAAPAAQPVATSAMASKN